MVVVVAVAIEGVVVAVGNDSAFAVFAVKQQRHPSTPVYPWLTSARMRGIG